MTPSLPLLAAASLVGGLLGAPHPRVAPITLVAPPGGVAPATLVAPPGGVASGPDVVEHVVAATGRSYWTPERMARAIPIGLFSAVGRVGTLAARVLPARGRSWQVPQSGQARRPGTALAITSGSTWQAGGSVTRTTGRVFLTMNGVDFVCSASAVRSANRDVVVTAGHCVKDATGAWAQNWTFVPGYRDGRQPYGSFTARRMFVAGPWSRDGDDDYDVGMVAVDTADGRHLTDAVGGQQISFNAQHGLRTYGFGFPADPPYDGERLLYCAGFVHGDSQGQTHDQGLRCDLTAGASGGPWLTGFDPATGRGVLTSVSSFKYSNDHHTMYGPYFGAPVRDLFRIAERA